MNTLSIHWLRCVDFFLQSVNWNMFLDWYPNNRLIIISIYIVACTIYKNIHFQKCTSTFLNKLIPLDVKHLNVVLWKLYTYIYHLYVRHFITYQIRTNQNITAQASKVTLAKRAQRSSIHVSIGQLFMYRIGGYWIHG